MLAKMSDRLPNLIRMLVQVFPRPIESFKCKWFIVIVNAIDDAMSFLQHKRRGDDA